jgi:phosphatidylglycerophosphate synthase
MPSIQEMRQVCQKKVPNKKGKMVYSDHFWARFVTRHYSIYLTRMFVALGVSANEVTFLMMLTGLAAFALCIPHILWANILGLIFWYLFEALDCCDGEVARWTKTSSVKGVYLDLLTHVLVNHTIKAVVPLHLYFLTHEVKYVFIAFVSYAVDFCSDSILLCNSEIERNALARGVELSAIRKSKIPKWWRYLRGLSGMSVCFIYFFVFLPVPMSFLYLGLISWVEYFVWVIIILEIWQLVVQIINDYYFSLSDATHAKIIVGPNEAKKD